MSVQRFVNLNQDIQSPQTEPPCPHKPRFLDTFNSNKTHCVRPWLLEWERLRIAAEWMA